MNGKKMKEKEIIQRLMVSVLSAMLLIGLYRIIFAFSGQDAATSGSLSHRISEKCVELANSLTGSRWTQQAVSGLTDFFEHPIRKLAHLGEYACMGVLVYNMWRPWRRLNSRLCLVVTAWVFLSAAGDELHQRFVPGRYGCITDVLLDTVGGILGLLCCVCFEILIRKRLSRKTA